MYLLGHSARLYRSTGLAVLSGPVDVYGLTGGIGSGKSAVAGFLEDFGVPVVSADELSRIVVAAGSEGLAEVVRAFGPEVLDDKGELDRRKMASIVFREPARRQQLESILHPRIRERFEQVLDAVEKAGHAVTVYEVPLLFEKNLQADMKATILVTASEATRVARVMERDQVTETEVRDRIASQMPDALKRKRADYIIENDGTIDQLRREVRFLLERFLRIDARQAPGRFVSDTPSTDPGSQVDPQYKPRRVTEVPTHAPTPSRTPTEVPADPPAPPSSVGTQPHIPHPEEPSGPSSGVTPPPHPPAGARIPTPAPPPPPGLNLPVPTPVPETHSPVPAPASPPSSNRTEPALPPTPRPTTQPAPAVSKDDEA